MWTTTAAPDYNAQLMLDDCAAKGWEVPEWAAKAGVADETIYRFLKGTHRTNKTARKLARALRKPLARYVVAA